MRSVKHIILHCSAMSNQSQTAAVIRKLHTDPPPKGRGWKDIGYHYFIKFDGIVELGRSLETVGAHCEGYNEHSVGICLAGLHDWDFTPDQFSALRSLLTTLKMRYPDATLHPHSEFDKKGKTCPVFDINPFNELWNSLNYCKKPDKLVGEGSK